MSRSLLRRIIPYIIIASVIGLAFYLIFGGVNTKTTVDITQIGNLISENIATNPDMPEEIAPVALVIEGQDIEFSVNGVDYETRIDGTFSELLVALEGVERSAYSITYAKPSFLSGLFSILLTLLPFFLIFGLLIFFLRQAQGGGNQAMGFGRNRAKLFAGGPSQVSFSDVAGAVEAKEELMEIVEFLKYPEKFRALGARIPKGVLLIGPPGTGKTLVSRAVAGEAGVPFFSISGSEFVEMFVGVGASRVRDLFEQAKKQSPCIIFVDEIDAVGRHRGAGLGGGHDEREQTLNQILVEMDGFDSNTNVIVIAATNRPDILDPALTRPGRFDRKVILDAPDVRGRVEIMRVHAKGKPIMSSVDFDVLARQTPGFSGADIANLINEAALLTARRNKTEIGMDELTESIDRVSIGPARKSRVVSKEERAMVAYHESGHAIVSHLAPEGKPVGKISITSRGHAGGFTRYQQDDRSLHTKGELKAMIASAMGGRVAEQIKFDKITTGATNDIEAATKIARQMVTHFGMSDKMGLRVYGKREGAIFLGREMSEERNYSLKTEETIDSEIDSLIKIGTDMAHDILTKNNDKLEALAQYLLANETAEADAFSAIMEGKTPEVVVKNEPQPSESTPKPEATSEDPAVQKPPSPKIALGSA